MKDLGRFSGYGSSEMKGIRYLLKDTGIGHAGSNDRGSMGQFKMGI